jgi:hypothetical protein
METVGTGAVLLSGFEGLGEEPVSHRKTKDEIRSNLEMSWAFGLQMEAEEKAENEARAQTCQVLEDRIAAQPLSPSERERFLTEITTLVEQGRIAPFHARRLTRAVRRSR